MSKKAVMVFSGGQDSTTCLIQALPLYDEVHCITFDYGQRHVAEVEVAQRLAQQLGATVHKVMDVSLLNELAISSLTRDNIPVPTVNSSGESLPSTFVPGRNILFLTLASIYAYQVKAETVITGVCETDFSGYPDCRDNTLRALQVAISLGLDAPMTLDTPLMWLDKAQTWALTEQLGGEPLIDVVVEHTHTCYLGDRSQHHAWGYGCGLCPACDLRRKGYNTWVNS